MNVREALEHARRRLREEFNGDDDREAAKIIEQILKQGSGTHGDLTEEIHEAIYG